jgi:peptidyl-prolyl cis-trans isomerase C
MIGSPGRNRRADMRSRVFICALWVIASLAFSCGKSEDAVVARYGDQTVTAAEIKDVYLDISPGSRPDLATIDQKERFARDVVSKEVMRMEAEKLGLDRLPEVEEVRNSALRREAWNRYYEDHVASPVTVDESEIRELYETRGKLYDLSWIFLRSGRVAEELARRIDAGESFEKLASLYSIDPSREQGGDLGMRSLGTFPPELATRIMEMDPGQVSEVIDYDNYYVLVKMKGKEDVDKQDFQSARPGLETVVRAQKEN